MQCCSVMQCWMVLGLSSITMCVASVAVCCSVLQCVASVAVCCSVLQCVAVCCSVLQCDAVLDGAQSVIHDQVCRSVL